MDLFGFIVRSIQQTSRLIHPKTSSTYGNKKEFPHKNCLKYMQTIVKIKPRAAYTRKHKQQDFSLKDCYLFTTWKEPVYETSSAYLCAVNIISKAAGWFKNLRCLLFWLLPVQWNLVKRRKAHQRKHQNIVMCHQGCTKFLHVDDNLNRGDRKIL